MHKQPLSGVALGSLVLLSSCAQQPAQPARPVETSPSLEFPARYEVDFGAGAKAMIWDLRGEKVRDLNARLLVYSDGKVTLRSEIDCNWDDLSKPLAAQLVFLSQNGDLFGAKGKYLPSLSLSFQSGGPQRRSESLSASAIDVASRSMATLLSDPPTPTHGIWTKRVMCTRIFSAPNEGSWSSGGGPDEEFLVAESKKGRIALAVFLDWKR
jgi:hypothetical protein